MKVSYRVGDVLAFPEGQRLWLVIAINDDWTTRLVALDDERHEQIVMGTIVVENEAQLMSSL